MNAVPKSLIGNCSSVQYEEVFDPDNIFIKKELLSDFKLSNESSSRRSENPNEPVSFSTQFCVLCLRECTSDVVVRFAYQPKRNRIDVNDAHLKLEQVLGLTVALDDSCVICRACWKLVEIVGDFRESCIKSAGWIERFSRGMQYKAESDRWLSRYLFSSMETVHKAILDNRKRIDTEEIASSPSEIDVTRDEHTEAVMEVDTEFEVENEVPTHDEDIPDNESLKPVDLAIALLGGDNHSASILSCEKCGRKFDGPLALRMHAERCVIETGKSKLYTCSICNASFKELSGLRFHINKHNGVRPYKCRKYCDLTFFSNYVRIKHERRICELDGRICPTCGTRLKNEFSLKKHIEAVHGEAKHHCTKCTKVFRTSRALRNHQSAHSDERKYVCKVCEKGYKSMYAVKVHMRTHTQERPFACHLCDQTFNYKVSMKSHIERHHGQMG